MTFIQSSALSSLPAEILTNIISIVLSSRAEFESLRLVCHQFNDILHNYETSIACELVKTQLAPNTLHRFPGLVPSRTTRLDYRTVHRLQRRWEILEQVEKSCYAIKRRNVKQAEWMTPQWIKLQGVGLCLIFRLRDLENNDSQAALIRELPPTSLAILLFTLTMSIHQLRADGPDILNIQSPVQVAACRCEIELACEELLLQHGADFLVSLLEEEPGAIRMLVQEYDSMEVRQMPNKDGSPKPPTLISVLRRSVSASLNCDWRDNLQYMWKLLDSDRLKNMTEDDAARIIRGQYLSWDSADSVAIP